MIETVATNRKYDSNTVLTIRVGELFTQLMIISIITLTTFPLFIKMYLNIIYLTIYLS